MLRAYNIQPERSWKIVLLFEGRESTSVVVIVNRLVTLSRYSGSGSDRGAGARLLVVTLMTFISPDNRSEVYS